MKQQCAKTLVRYEVLSFFVVLFIVLPYIVFLVWNILHPPMCACPTTTK